MNIIFVLEILLVILMPYIMCAILAAIIIGIIDTNLIKSKKMKILIVVVILLCVCIILINIKKEKPSDLYLEMSEINDSRKLIGLSEEEVVALLGEPKSKYNEDSDTIFRYNAGNIGKGLYLFNKAIFFDSYDGYVLEVFFNEDNKVESTILQYVP